MIDHGDVRITDVGDTAFNIEFGAIVDRQINARVMGLHQAVARRMAAEPIAGLVEVVPTFRSLQVVYDPTRTDRQTIEDLILGLLRQDGGATAHTPRTWRLPVCYEGDLGPDVDEVGQACGMTRDQVIALHGSAEYFVYMLGFMPGFAYMGGVPERLRLPRRSSPRVKVPAGSVAIADELSAVYPWESPGGWHLLGRSPVTFFDLARDPPVLLCPGDLVRFYPIDRAAFDAMAANGVDPQSLLARMH
jgi:KipI family sensor histidine kinase inhibitor